MKHSFLFLSLIFVNFVSAQNFYSGALPTDTNVYNQIGQAPLPIGSNIPNVIDLSQDMPPAGNQYYQNSCVAWALAYANYSYINHINNSCNYLTNNTFNSNCVFSPSYIYNQINGGQNIGTHFQDAFRIMQTQGVAPLGSMPYIPNNWTSQPDPNSRSIASNYKIDSYWQLGISGDDLFIDTKAFLAQNIPVVAAVIIDDYLKKTSNFSNPYIWTNLYGANSQMRHAILIVGYDNSLNAFKFLNSYGQGWGNNGYGYISYNLFRQVIREAFIIKPKNSTANTQSLLARNTKQLTNTDNIAGLYFRVQNVSHFQFPPGYIPSPYQYSTNKMTFHGSLSIPTGLGNTAQIAIYFYLNNNGQKGLFISSLNPNTRALNGQAVIGTPLVNLQANIPFQSTFWAEIRSIDLLVQKGYPNAAITTYLLAEPVLLIDGFPVIIGDLYPFFVSL
jgi:hypothetical protein